mmetsp:Transcript_17638/g.21419  ORF Transcript_17638/g.21419 Transcript_17638/m.21419 type:complete len:385 (+) Transcript_17638:3-1157(+)
MERCVFVISKSGQKYTGLIDLCKLVSERDVRQGQRELNPYGVPIPSISKPGEGFDNAFLMRNLWGFTDFEYKDKYVISPIDPGFDSVVASSSGAMVATAKLYEIVQSNSVQSEMEIRIPQDSPSETQSDEDDDLMVTPPKPAYVLAVVLLGLIEFALYLPPYGLWILTHLATALLGIPVMILAALHALFVKILTTCFRNKSTNIEAPTSQQSVESQGSNQDSQASELEGPVRSSQPRVQNQEQEESTFYFGGIVFMVLEVLKVSLTLWMKFIITTWILCVKALMKKILDAHLVSTPKLQLYFLPPLGASEERVFKRSDLFESGAGYWEGSVKLVADIPLLGRTYPVAAVRLANADTGVHRSRVSGHGFDWPVNGGTSEDVGLTG